MMRFQKPKRSTCVSERYVRSATTTVGLRIPEESPVITFSIHRITVGHVWLASVWRRESSDR